MALTTAIASFVHDRIVWKVRSVIDRRYVHDDDTVATVDTSRADEPRMSAQQRSAAAIEALREEDAKKSMFAPMFWKVAIFLVLFPVLSYFVIIWTGILDEPKGWNRIAYESFPEISSMTMSRDGSVVAVGSLGCVIIFEVDPWISVTNICEPEKLEFGSSVSLSDDGTILAVSGVREDIFAGPGFVRTYSYSGTSWAVLGQDLVGESMLDYFGSSLALSGTGQILAVGASGISTVGLYAFNSSHWNRMGSSIKGLDKHFGASMSLSSRGDIIAIGSPWIETNGTVTVFRQEESQWKPLFDPIQGAFSGEVLGYSVSVATRGDTVVVAAGSRSLNGNFSRVQVYESFGSDTWDQVKTDIVRQDASEVYVDLADDASYLALGARMNTNVFSITSPSSLWEGELLAFNISGGQQVKLTSSVEESRLAVVGTTTDAQFVAVYQNAM